MADQQEVAFPTERDAPSVERLRELLALAAHQVGLRAYEMDVGDLRREAVRAVSNAAEWRAPEDAFGGAWSRERAVGLARAAYLAAVHDVCIGVLDGRRAATEAPAAVDGPIRHRMLADLAHTEVGERPSAIAERLGVTTVSVSRTAGELERAGLIEKREDESLADKRAVLYVLTEAGSAELERFREFGPAPARKTDVARTEDRRRAALALVDRARTARRHDDVSERYVPDLVRIRESAHRRGDADLWASAAGELVAAARRRRDVEQALRLLSEFGDGMSSYDGERGTAAHAAKGRYCYESARLADLLRNTADQSRPTDAETWLSAALSHYADVSSREGSLMRGLCHETLSSMRWRQGDLIGALHSARRSVGETVDSRDPFAIVHSSTHLAFCARLVGHWNEAARSLDRAETLLRDNDWPYWKASLLLHRGETLRYRGRPADALGPLTNALGLFATHPSGRGEIVATSARGACLYELGDEHEARSALQAASQLAAERRYAEEESLARRRLGQACATEDRDEARKHLEHVHTMYTDSVPSPVGRLEALTALVATSPDDDGTLRSAVDALVSLPGELKAIVSSSADRNDEQYRLVDLWVYRGLREAAEKHDRVLYGAVGTAWAELVDQEWAAKPTAQGGRSWPTSKEPLTVC